MPLETDRFSFYPVRVVTYKEQRNPDTRLVGESPRAYVAGSVLVDGVETLVWVEFDRKRGAPRALGGWVGIDVNHDGAINISSEDREYVFADERQPVFRIGNDYISLDSVDLDAGTVVFRANSASDYRLVEREPGTQVPDFSYQDFEGNGRRLSEFRGNPVLLDFWATWCPPCIADIPELKRLYNDLRGVGFEIIGINVDEDRNKAVQMIREKGLAWSQATRESTIGLVRDMFRVRAYPSYILLDGELKIVASGLRGENLDRTVRDIVSAGRR